MNKNGKSSFTSQEIRFVFFLYGYYFFYYTPPNILNGTKKFFIILFYDMKQKGDDYKLSAVNYYMNNDDTMDNTCKIFNCI